MAGRGARGVRPVGARRRRKAPQMPPHASLTRIAGQTGVRRHSLIKCPERDHAAPRLATLVCCVSLT